MKRRKRKIHVLLRMTALLLTAISGKAAESEIDPLVEILKHAFVLRLSLRRMSQAKELESLISKLYTQEGNTDTTIATLQLLIELKNFQTDTEAALVSNFANSVVGIYIISALMRIKSCLGCIPLWQNQSLLT